jgi:hypothetical protein
MHCKHDAVMKANIELSACEHWDSIAVAEKLDNARFRIKGHGRTCTSRVSLNHMCRAWFQQLAAHQKQLTELV